MRVSFKTFFRATLAFLAITLGGSLWASAQTATNLTPLAATNQHSVVVREVE